MYKIQEENAEFSQRDEFERKKIAEKLYALLKDNIQGLSPVMINGTWGTGKTEFCAKFINYIKNEEAEAVKKDTTHKKIAPLYINAFQADHIDQAFMTIMGVLYSYLEENQVDKGLCESFLSSATPIFKGLSKLGVGDVAKLALNFAVDTIIPDNIKGATSELVKVTLENSDDILDKELREKFKSFVKLDKTITTFKDTLKELAEETPFIIFVDELDRCRPDFSVALLECIKHIFDVKNVQFILVCNSMQLTASIKHRYGASIDAENYLEKFFGFKVNLINQKRIFTSFNYTQDISNDICFLKGLIDNKTTNEKLKEYLFTTMLNSNNDFFLRIFILPLSLRLREKFITNFSIYWRLTAQKPNEYRRYQCDLYQNFNSFLGVYIHTINQDLSSNLFQKTTSCMELAKFLEIEDAWGTFEAHINNKVPSELPFTSNENTNIKIRLLIMMLFDESYPKHDASVTNYIRDVEDFKNNRFPQKYHHDDAFKPTYYMDLISVIHTFNLSA